MGNRGFWRELKRRHVYRVAGAYAVVGWLLIQVVTQVFPVFHLPDWIDQAVVLLILVGFPIALVLAWAFDATPQGIVRTDAGSAVAVDATMQRRSRRAGVAVGLIGVAFAIAAGAAWRWHSHPQAMAAVAKPVASDGSLAAVARPGAAQAIPSKSIAVLPLSNESGDKDQQYFSDGLSDELISALGQAHDLKVIGRNSSFRFRGKAQDDSAGIGAKLGVATLLEGTVGKQADEVRIVVSLIKASDGSILWSRTYDRQLKDVFAVQSDIATSVANALKANVFERAVEVTDKPPSGNVAAYEAMLQGHYYAERRTRADYARAVKFYQQAIALDPDYALAYARLAIADQWFNDWVADTDERKVAGAQARANAQHAIALAPQSASALGALGIVQAWTDFDYPAAEATLKKAVALDPSNAETLYQLADVTFSMGRFEPAIAMMRKTLTLEPLTASFHFYFGAMLLAVGRFDESEAELRRAVELQPGAEGYASTLGLALMERGKFDAALAVAATDPNGPDQEQAAVMIEWARGDKARAQAQLDHMIRLYGNTSPGLIAEAYAFEGNVDPAMAWLGRAVQANDPTAVTVYETLPEVISTLNRDPRFAAFRKKYGMAAPNATDALPASGSSHD